jgi:hypothetical protein
MSQGDDRLRFRRQTLLRRSELERQQLRQHMTHIEAAVDSVDRGLAKVRSIATPVLVGGGVLAALVLGRSGTRRIMAGGLGLLGLFSRFGSPVRLIAQLLRGQAPRRQAVRRSR